MKAEMTEEQKTWIELHSEEYDIPEMAKIKGLSYQQVYNFCERYNLKYKLTRKEPSRSGIYKQRLVPNEYGNEVIPDPPRKWERPPSEYSNTQRDELIDKILKS